MVMSEQDTITKPTARQLAGLDPIPTRIIKEPYRAKVDGYKRTVFVCSCDDGNTYTISDLAKIVGLNYNGLVHRLRYYGWQSPLILKGNSKGKRLDGKKLSNNKNNNGNEAWKKLSNKPRNKRLVKL